MHKQEFLDRLRDGLSGLPQNDIEERLTFYDEMIDDRMEEGLSEEEAITEIGSVDQIISNIIADSPKAEAIKENIKPNRPWKAWEIVLLILGAPLWIPLLIAVASIVFACYIAGYLLHGAGAEQRDTGDEIFKTVGL